MCQFGQLILSQIIKVVAAKSRICALNLVLAGANPRPRWRSIQRSNIPSSWILRVLLLKRRARENGKRRGEEERKGRKKEGKERGKNHIKGESRERREKEKKMVGKKADVDGKKKKNESGKGKERGRETSPPIHILATPLRHGRSN